MRVIRHIGELPPQSLRCVVALGNFDGVHVGHRAVMDEAGRQARALAVQFAVMTFEPHPRLLFQPQLPPFRLTPFRVKIRLIEEMGVDLCLMQHFDQAFARVTAEEFVTKLLVARLGVMGVVVGHDYVFGYQRQGNPDFLRSMGQQLGFGVTVVDPVSAEDGEVYSSTTVRMHLTEGRPRDAARLLGRPWEIEGRVEHGDKRGRTIGFPTANLGLEDYLRPATGVYAVKVGLTSDGGVQWHDGVANFGHRPTFDKTDELLEVHIMDYSGDLYGRHVRVQLLDYIRPEQKFLTLDDLKQQINRDAAQARNLLAAK
jgi:riboflavin kinase / FMN adenylyltransferase